MSQHSGKVEKDVNASTANKLLVICVDRDNDVGEMATKKTDARDALDSNEGVILCLRQ